MAQQLFLSYRWPELWQTIATAQNRTQEATLWKAALLAAWWQSGVEAKRSLPPLNFVLVSKTPLLVFVTGLVSLCLGDSQPLPKVFRRLHQLKAPTWMTQWLSLERCGRARQFDLQATLIKDLPATLRDKPWPYAACLQSLDQDDIDPQPLLQVLSTFSDLPLIGIVLRSRLLVAANRYGEAISLLQPLAFSDAEASPIAAYHLGLAAAGTFDLPLAVRAWDFAAQHGCMDRTSLERWLSASISHPSSGVGVPWRVAEAIKICSAPGLSAPERNAAALSSYQLIYEWIEGRLDAAYAIVAQHHTFNDLTKSPDELPESDRNAQIFFRYVLRLCFFWQVNQSLYDRRSTHPLLYFLGESHSLSPAHTVFEWQGTRMRGKTCFVMGIKMWHLASPQENFYKTALRLQLNRLPKYAALVLCVGEIDCRPNEGIWLQKSRSPTRSLAAIIDETVTGYLYWVNLEVASVQPITVTIQGIPAPGYPLVGKRDPGDRAGFLAMIRAVNEALKTRALALGWQFLDIYSATRNDEGSGNGAHHLDGFHLKPSFYQDAGRWLVESARPWPTRTA